MPERSTIDVTVRNRSWTMASKRRHVIEEKGACANRRARFVSHREVGALGPQPKIDHTSTTPFSNHNGRISRPEVTNLRPCYHIKVMGVSLMLHSTCGRATVVRSSRSRGPRGRRLTSGDPTGRPAQNNDFTRQTDRQEPDRTTSCLRSRRHLKNA